MTLSRFSTMSGRIVLGVSAVLYAALCLRWHDADTWQGLNTIWAVPFGSVLGGCAMVALMVGGIAVMLPKAMRAGAILLAVVLAIFTLACVPPIVQAPKVYGSYVEFFEILAVFAGAIALIATTESSDKQRITLSRWARIVLGICSVSFALAQYVYFKFTASLVPAWIPPSPAFWTWLTTIAFALSAISIITKLCARLALRLLTLIIVVFGVLVWIPHTVAHPESHNNWSELALNFLIAGACWMVAELPTL